MLQGAGAHGPLVWGVMEHVAAFLLVAVVASQLLAILVIPAAALRRILRRRRHRSAVFVQAPALPPRAANDACRWHFLADPSAAPRRANDNG